MLCGERRAGPCGGLREAAPCAGPPLAAARPLRNGIRGGAAGVGWLRFPGFEKNHLRLPRLCPFSGILAARLRPARCALTSALSRRPPYVTAFGHRPRHASMVLPNQTLSRPRCQAEGGAASQSGRRRAPRGARAGGGMAAAMASAAERAVLVSRAERSGLAVPSGPAPAGAGPAGDPRRPVPGWRGPHPRLRRSVRAGRPPPRRAAEVTSRAAPAGLRAGPGRGCRAALGPAATSSRGFLLSLLWRPARPCLPAGASRGCRRGAPGAGRCRSQPCVQHTATCVTDPEFFMVGPTCC